MPVVQRILYTHLEIEASNNRYILIGLCNNLWVLGTDVSRWLTALTTAQVSQKPDSEPSLCFSFVCEGLWKLSQHDTCRMYIFFQCALNLRTYKATLFKHLDCWNYSCDTDCVCHVLQLDEFERVGSLKKVDGHLNRKIQAAQLWGFFFFFVKGSWFIVCESL